MLLTAIVNEGVLAVLLAAVVAVVCAAAAGTNLGREIVRVVNRSAGEPARRGGPVPRPRRPRDAFVATHLDTGTFHAPALRREGPLPIAAAATRVRHHGVELLSRVNHRPRAAQLRDLLPRRARFRPRRRQVLVLAVAIEAALPLWGLRDVFQILLGVA